MPVETLPAETNVGETNVPKEVWDTEGEPQVEAKKQRERKPKPVIRVRNRRAKKSEEITSKKLIQEIHNGTTFQIQFPIELREQLEPQVLAINGAHYRRPIPYDPKGDTPADQLTWLAMYWCPSSEETLQLVHAFGKSNRFDFGSDIAIRAHAASTDGKKLERMSYAKSATIEFPKWITAHMKRNKLIPKPFQKAGVAYVSEAKNCFIADEMGLGKTIQAILSMAYDDRLKEKWIIVVPSSLRINWYKECHKWFGKRVAVSMMRNKNMKTTQVRNRKTRTMETRLSVAAKKFLEETDVFIMTYDKVHRFGEFLENRPFRGIIFDESHYLKGRSTKRTIRYKKFVADLREKGALEYTLLLSGTPLMNRPMDLISQLQILDRLADFGGYNHFMTRYCTISTTDTTHVSAVHKMERAKVEPGEEVVDVQAEMSEQTLDKKMQDAMVRKLYENMTALNKALRSTCYIRREKVDVLTDLPAKTRSTIAIEITNRKDYEAIERDVIGFLIDRIEKDEKFLKSISHLKGESRRAAITERRGTVAYKTARAEALVRLENLKQAAAFGKLKGTKEWIENFLESGKKLMVFATHNKILDELEAMFPKNSVSIRSHLSAEGRDAALTAFNDNPKVKLCFCGLKLALGLNAQKSCSDTLTLEFGWNPALHDQAEDRVYRIGQKYNVTAYYHVARRTVEERIGNLIEKKRKTVNSVAIGDPLAGADQGSVLGDLMTALIGKQGLMN